jgi:hypothetical protein
MTPPVLDVTRLTARRAIWTQNRVIVGLDGDDRLLQARQDLLRLSQCQPQLGDLAEATKWPDTQYIDDPCRTIDPGFNQAQNPRHSRTRSQQTDRPVISPAPSSPHILDTPLITRCRPVTSVPREALMRSIATLTTVASSMTIALARLAASRVRLKDVVPRLFKMS